MLDINSKIELPKTSKFSISLWVKPIDNSYYNKILKLEDNNSCLYLLNNAENKEYKSQGITVSWDNGNLYNSNDYKLEIDIYSNIVFTINGKNIKVYLDGKKFLDTKLDSSLNNGNLILKTFKEFEYINVGYYQKELSENEILNNFKDEIDNKFKSLENNNIYPYSGGKFSLKEMPFYVDYISNSKSLILNNGYIELKENNLENEIVHKYQAKIRINNQEYSKELSIKQEGNNQDNIFKDKVKEVKNNINYYLSTSNTIEKVDDVNVEYEVISGNAKYDKTQNKFIKDDNAKEKEAVTIKCTVSDNEHIETFTKDFVLLDDYVGYLMVFFNGEDGWPMHLTGDETLYFAFSKDLNNWDILNDKPIITSDIGTGRFRDPFINRDKNGEFVITSTEGYYNPGIYITKSKDLSNFETTNVLFNRYDSLLGLKGNKSWAPEFIYNKDKDLYTIIYSEGESCNKGIYAVDTKDFINFSYPYLLLNTRYNSIDPDIALIKGNYYLFYKDERENSKNIYYAKTNDLSSNLWKIMDSTNLNNEYTAEGPFVIKDYNKNKYIIYLDGFKMSTIYSSDINVDGEEVNTNIRKNISMNKSYKRIRHFSIVPITIDEYTNILSRQHTFNED